MDSKNCKDFKQNKNNLETSKELSFDKECLTGKCDIDNTSCDSDAKCSSDSLGNKCK